MISVQLTKTISQFTAKLQQLVENLSIKIEIPLKSGVVDLPDPNEMLSLSNVADKTQSHQYAVRELDKTTCKIGISQVESCFHQAS
jgi:hypothetical protein